MAIDTSDTRSGPMRSPAPTDCGRGGSGGGPSGAGAGGAGGGWNAGGIGNGAEGGAGGGSGGAEGKPAGIGPAIVCSPNTSQVPGSPGVVVASGPAVAVAVVDGEAGCITSTWNGWWQWMQATFLPINRSSIFSVRPQFGFGQTALI